MFCIIIDINVFLELLYSYRLNSVCIIKPSNQPKYHSNYLATSQNTLLTTQKTLTTA